MRLQDAIGRAGEPAAQEAVGATVQGTCTQTITMRPPDGQPAKRTFGARTSARAAPTVGQHTGTATPTTPQLTPLTCSGDTVHRMTVGEVPVDGFWSVTVYN